MPNTTQPRRKSPIHTQLTYPPPPPKSRWLWSPGPSRHTYIPMPLDSNQSIGVSSHKALVDSSLAAPVSTQTHSSNPKQDLYLPAPSTKPHTNLLTKHPSIQRQSPAVHLQNKSTSNTPPPPPPSTKRTRLQTPANTPRNTTTSSTLNPGK